MNYWALKKRAIMGAAQSGKLTEETGYPLILENSKGEKLKDYRIWGDDDGLGASGTIDVVTSGKNLCAVNSVASVGWAKSMPEIKNSLNNLKAGTYTISFNISLVYKNEEKYMSSDFGGLLFVFSGKGQLYATTIWQTSEIGTTVKITRTITLAEEDVGTVTNVWAYGSGNMSTGGSGRADIFDIQFEEGTEATEYEPFKEPITTTIDLTGYNSIMSNDYIDFRNGCIVRSDGTEEEIYLPKIPTVKGYNIITASDAEIEATNMYGKYIKKG